GIAAARIHEGLRARGVASRFCVTDPLVGLEDAFSPTVTSNFVGRADQVARRAMDRWLLQRYSGGSPGYKSVLSTGIVGFDIRRIVARERPDILQLHWIGGNSFRLASMSGVRVPIVWRLADMWPLCGLEHYEPDHQKYVKPPRRWMRMNPIFFDSSEFVRYSKQATYRKITGMKIVCPSRWLMSEAKRSALLRYHDVIRIPTSCDTTLFSLKDRTASRKALGMPLDKFVVLVGRRSIAHRISSASLNVSNGNARKPLCLCSIKSGMPPILNATTTVPHDRDSR